MHKLTHFPLCPLSRSIRLVLAEHGIPFELVEEHPWEWRPAFLALNPAGELPVLELDGGIVLAGAYAICEFIAENPPADADHGRPAPLFPGNGEDRAEVRRLVDWFHRKMDREVTRELIEFKVFAHLRRQGCQPPDTAVLRAIHANLRYHLSYIGFLGYQRRWLAGDALSYADLAAAAHLSCIDYLGEVPWDEYRDAKEWYSRLKSRPALRPILADRVVGTPPPPAHYANLDF